MEKIARKPSSDPVQEKLRQAKADWNKQISEFIDDLIQFKKMMNGHASKFHQQKSFIKDPIPSDPTTIIGVLASDYAALAQKANGIIQQQIEYSKTRKQKQVKSFANDDFLYAEASNKLTRFISQFKGPMMGSSPDARKRKHRLSLLSIAHDMYVDFKSLQQEILKDTPESIYASDKILLKIQDKLHSVANALNAYYALVPSPTFPADQEPVQVSPTSQDSKAKDTPPVYVGPPIEESDPKYIKSIITDVLVNSLNFYDIDHSILSAFKQAKTLYTDSDNQQLKNKSAKDIISLYQDLLKDLNKRNHTDGKSLTEVLTLSKSSRNDVQMVADAFDNKYVNKIKHQLSLFDKTSALRLDISKQSDVCKKILDKMMSHLENDIDKRELEAMIIELSDKIDVIKKLIKPLQTFIKGKSFDSTFINLLQNKNLLDHSTDISDKSQQKLKEMIETRRLRDLSRMYDK